MFLQPMMVKVDDIKLRSNGIPNRPKANFPHFGIPCFSCRRSPRAAECPRCRCQTLTLPDRLVVAMWLMSYPGLCQCLPWKILQHLALEAPCRWIVGAWVAEMVVKCRAVNRLSIYIYINIYRCFNMGKPVSRWCQSEECSSLYLLSF